MKEFKTNKKKNSAKGPKSRGQFYKEAIYAGKKKLDSSPKCHFISSAVKPKWH